jgi:hypothetical protein
MEKSKEENDMAAKFLRTSIGHSSLCGDEDLLGDSLLVTAGIGKWRHQHMTSSSPTL